MNMFDDLDNINTILRSDDHLWKLLYYKSKWVDDDILSKPSILDLPSQEKHSIMELRLKHTPVTDDLVDQQICRIIFYQAPRRPHSENYKFAEQDINFDVFVHREFNDTDMRLAKICDRINELFSDKHITSLGKTQFVSGKPFRLSNEGYIGYTLTYRFGSIR